MTPPLNNRLAVVLYAGNHSEWEPVLHEATQNFGPFKNRLYIVGSARTPAPQALLDLAQNAFEEVFQIQTTFDGPRGFAQRSVYEVAAKIMEHPGVAHRGPLLWLGRPVDIHRSTWLDEVEREYVAAYSTQQALFMSALFVVPGNGNVPISAFLTPHDWAASPHAGNFRRLKQMTPLSEEPVNYALREELTRSAVFRPTSLFGAADTGVNPVWAFSVRKLDQPIGPKRVQDQRGGNLYDPQDLLRWLEASGTRGVDANVFGRSVYEYVRSGLMTVKFTSAYSETTAQTEKPAEPVKYVEATEVNSVRKAVERAEASGYFAQTAPSEPVEVPPFLSPPAEQEQPEPEPPPAYGAGPVLGQTLPDGAVVSSLPTLSGAPGLAILPPRPPSGEPPVTAQVVTIGIPNVPTTTPNPVKTASKPAPKADKPKGKRQVVTA